MKPIVMVASLSIFALIISFLILLGYGLITYKLTWKQSFLFPLSATSFFSSIGIPSYSLGYNFSFLSFYVSFLFLLLFLSFFQICKLSSLSGYLLVVTLFKMICLFSNRDGLLPSICYLIIRYVVQNQIINSIIPASEAVHY